MIGFNSEENRNVRETQIPRPAVMFPAHVQPQSHHKMALLSSATWRVMLAFRVFLTPLPRSLLGIIGALQTVAGLGKYPDPSKRGESREWR